MKNPLMFCLSLIAALVFAPAAMAQNRAEHVLGPNDSIDIKVFQEPELDTKVTISQDGKVSLPLIGEVSVAGQTISEASRLIAAKYKQGYLVNPNVTVAMGEYAKRRFTILGAVNKPGAFFFPPGENVSLLQAIGMAGGFSRYASPSKILIKRGDAGQPIKLDAKKMTKNGEASTYMIKPGDIIEVGESVL